jgi:thiamine-phosphate pyrophosphorylase
MPAKQDRSRMLDCLRLVLVTDGRGDLPRLEAIVAAAVAGGVRCVQLRESHWSARMLLAATERLGALLSHAGGLLLVNDRIDVAMAGHAHGAQVGHRSLPPEMARRVLGPSAILGYSAHDQAELDLAAAAGCDFALLSPVWATTSKPGMPHLGEARATALTGTARLPVVWLGGVCPPAAARIGDLPPHQRPAGIAVRSAIMSAEDPRHMAASLLRSFQGANAG